MAVTVHARAFQAPPNIPKLFDCAERSVLPRTIGGRGRHDVARIRPPANGTGESDVAELILIHRNCVRGLTGSGGPGHAHLIC